MPRKELLDKLNHNSLKLNWFSLNMGKIISPLEPLMCSSKPV
jgi:hypothetical protein